MFIWGLVVVYAGILSVFAVIEDTGVPGIDRMTRESDKLLHIAAYAVLGALLLRAMVWGRSGLPPRRVFWTAILATAAYGVFTEVQQHFVGGRYPSVGDALANLVGAWAGATGVKWHLEGERGPPGAAG